MKAFLRGSSPYIAVGIGASVFGFFALVVFHIWQTGQFFDPSFLEKILLVCAAIIPIVALLKWLVESQILSRQHKVAVRLGSPLKAPIPFRESTFARTLQKVSQVLQQELWTPPEESSFTWRGVRYIEKTPRDALSFPMVFLIAYALVMAAVFFQVYVRKAHSVTGKRVSPPIIRVIPSAEDAP